MNILHVVPSLDPAAGGPPRIALSLAAAAAPEHNVTILYYDSPHAQIQINQQLADIPNSSRIHFEKLPPPSRIERLIASQARAHLLRIIPQADILHVHSIWNRISVVAMSVARKHHVPYVMLVNGMLDPWSLAQRSWKKKIALATGIRSLLNNAAFLQAGNSGEKDCIAAAGFTSPIKIIANGIDPDSFKDLPIPGSFHAAHPRLKGRPYILFLGRLHFKKGLDYLAGAFAMLANNHPDLQLVIAGPDDGARADLENDIQNRQLQDRVHILGPIFGHDKHAALQDASCFCLPSRQEGFSVAVLEAMACQTPVVISAACHFPEVAERGAGMITPLDAAAIAAAIQPILIDPSLRIRMGVAAREMVYQEFTWPKVVQQLIAAYEQCLRGAEQKQ